MAKARNHLLAAAGATPSLVASRQDIELNGPALGVPGGSAVAADELSNALGGREPRRGLSAVVGASRQSWPVGHGHSSMRSHCVRVSRLVLMGGSLRRCVKCEPFPMDWVEPVFDTRRVTTTFEYRLTCDRCHRQYPKRSPDQIHLGELARDDGWVRDGKRDVCAECRHEASERALQELAERSASPAFDSPGAPCP